MTDPTPLGDGGESADPEPGLPRAVLRVLRPDAGPSPLYAYEFLHPAVAATVVLHDQSRGAYLLIRRGRDPFKGCCAFPGGFIDVGKEDIQQTAVRELREETGVEIERADLTLIDVRSAPDRDPRDHVFDIGFFAEVERAKAEALDETTGIVWATPKELDSMALAFDHSELWNSVKQFRS